MIFDIKIKNFGPFGEEDKNNDLTVNFYYSSISNPIINIIGDNNSGKSCLLSIINWSKKWNDEIYFKNLMKNYNHNSNDTYLRISYIFNINETKQVIVSKYNIYYCFFSTIYQNWIPYWYVIDEYEHNKHLFNNINHTINQQNWQNWQKIKNYPTTEDINNFINDKNFGLYQINNDYELDLIYNLCNGNLKEKNKYLDLLNEVNQLFFSSKDDYLKLEEYNTYKWKNCSIGTKWFFTICFRIIELIEKNSGIFCIDEPEKYLSIPNQKKLFKFIKDKIENFKSENKKNKFQIFIATNSPYMMDNEFLFNSKIIFKNKNKTSIIANDIECLNRKVKCFEQMLPIENILKILGIDINEENWINNLLNKAFFVEGLADFYFLKILFKLNDDLRKYFNNILIIPMSGRDKLKNSYWKDFINSYRQNIIFLDSDNDNNYRESEYQKILFLNELYNSDSNSAIDRFGPEDLLEEKTRKKYNINENNSSDHAKAWFKIYLDFYENNENVFTEKDIETLKNVANKIYNKTKEKFEKS